MASSTSHLFLSSLMFASLCGCGAVTSAEPPGTEGGPCIEGECLAGLQCLSEICVDDPGGDGTGTTPPGGKDDDEPAPSDSGGADEGAAGSESGSSDEATTSSTTSATGAADTSEGTTGPSDTSTSGIDTFGDSTTGDWPGSDDGGVGFILDPDGGGGFFECSPWEQDCPGGEKCMPWANDGGSSWNATRCSPVQSNPGGIGDSCVVEGSGVSGVDSCELGAVCWDVDPETNEGTCVAQCMGSPDAPSCPQGTTCSISNNEVLTLCLDACDPLVQGCPPGQGCYPQGGTFICAPDASERDGEQGDPCEFVNACDPGWQCVTPDAVPDCFGSVGCCTSFCDLSGPDICAGLGAGLECIPVYEGGQAPDGLEDVGTCLLPN